MKKNILIFLLLLILAPAMGRAQTDADELEWLTVDFWPDYDRPSVLVLVTGAVAGGIPLPAEVTIPVPADATLNAVARITDANELIDDIEHTTRDDTLTLTTPERRFRVEYYFPYTASDLERDFAFTWLADLTIGDLQITVQQPAVATNLETDPEAVSVEEEDGLDYHHLPPIAVNPGDPYRVTVSYSMSNPTLTAAGGPAAAGAETTSGADPAAASGLSWPGILALSGGLLALLAIGWYFFGERLRPARSAPRKPRPARANAARKADPSRAARNQPAPKPVARFCHECGAAAEEDDRFCRACGKRLKGRQ